MGEGFIVRRGGGGQQTVKPIYNSLTEVGFTSLTLSVTNDSNSIATLYYSVVNTEPAPAQAGTFDTEFAGKETKNITITGLTSGTTYTVYIKAAAVGEFPSETVIVPNLTTTNSMTATGGTITEINVTNSPTKRYRVHTFTSNGTFAVTQLSNTASLNAVQYLIVGGAGSGGGALGAGGGAGGLVHNLNSAGLGVTVQNYSVTIGAGATGSTSASKFNGANTTALGITGLGGGGASSLLTQRNLGITTGNNGGSGGGCGASDSPGGLAGTATQPSSQWGGFGNKGGDQIGGGGQTHAGGGGGGANGVGTNATSSTNGGPGGAGLQVNIDGNNHYWAGGGGGARYQGGAGGAGGIGGGGGGATDSNNGPGTGGAGGGSARNSGGTGGNTTSSAGGNAGENTGSGGGGATWSAGRGGNGGSGIVIIRYEIAPTT
jgi:hypothetical protein